MIPGTDYIDEIAPKLDAYNDMITEDDYLKAKSLLAEYQDNYGSGGEMEYPAIAAEIIKQYEQGDAG